MVRDNSWDSFIVPEVAALNGGAEIYFAGGLFGCVFPALNGM